METNIHSVSRGWGYQNRHRWGCAIRQRHEVGWRRRWDKAQEM